MLLPTKKLHESLKEKTAQYFEDAGIPSRKNSTIFMIKRLHQPELHE